MIVQMLPIVTSAAANTISGTASLSGDTGYTDGSARPDGNITRAEVAKVVNRMPEREADEGFVNKNLANLVPFTDLTDTGAWYFYDMVEATNAHVYVTRYGREDWEKLVK